MLGSVPEYTTCSDCGTSIAPAALADHHCDERQRIDHAARVAVDGLEGLVGEIRRYLDSPHGRFEAFCAARERRR